MSRKRVKSAMSKKLWLIWALVNMIMGICGYVLLAFGFFAGLAAGGQSVAVVYAVLAAVALVLLLLFFFANKVVYRVFAQRAEKEIPPIIMTAGNLLAWAVVIAVYLIFTFMAP